ncbi:Ras-like guanine nucleotide exchange factor, partial [Trypanosoma melophagium]|uniref:Ras-like guanine nucleotide exchange factor n=1 Tax=Trypanosoma melophagium TaxID=715481 RepID=UPI00351A7681
MDVRKDYMRSEERGELLTNDHLRDMVGMYLRSAGMGEVAAKMYSEANTTNILTEADETNERLLLSLMDRCAVPRPRASQSVPPCELEWLLSPHTTTRAVIRRLLTDGERKLILQFHSMGLPFPNELAIRHILYSNNENIWSSQGDADALYVKGKKGKGPGMLVFGTLNQLIEELTHVSVFPLSSLSEEKILAQEKFTSTFLRQYRYFALSHAVLAKLMERFLVPFSVKLEFEHFEGHGVSIHAPGASLSTIISPSQVANNVSKNEEENYQLSHFSPSATLWLFVCRKIQLSVLSVLTLWLRKFPQHFDEEMCHCLSLFLEESCYTHQLWSDCPSQLTEMAEFLRCCLTEKEKSLQRQQECNGTRCRNSLSHVPPTLETFSIKCTSFTHQTSSFKKSLDEALSILSLTTTKSFTIEGKPLDDSFILNAKEVLRLYMSVSVDQYATAFTGLHRELFASLQIESLLHMTYRSSGAYLCSSFFRHS